MNVENQNAVEENEVVAIDVEETNNQTTTSEIPTVPEKEETRTNVQEKEQSDELEDYSENVKKRINQLTAKRKQALEEADACYAVCTTAEKRKRRVKTKAI